MGRNFKLPSKKWLWPVSVVLAGLSSCAVFTVLAIISVALTGYNCATGSSCAPFLGDIVAIGSGSSVATAIRTGLGLDPPATDLAYFHASQASAVLSPSNLSLASTGGTAIMAIQDESTGVVLGTQNFPFTINNDVATFTNPSQVTSWIHSFDTYSGNVKINFNFYTGWSNPPPGTTGSVTVTAEYANAPYASSKLSIVNSTSTKCPPPLRNCQPK